MGQASHLFRRLPFSQKGVSAQKMLGSGQMCMSRIVEFAYSQSQKIGIQLGHAGRKASTFTPFIPGPPTTGANSRECGWPDNVWGTSTVSFSEGHPVPKKLTKEGITRVNQVFKDAAVRSVRAGFDVIEVHSAQVDVFEPRQQCEN